MTYLPLFYTSTVLMGPTDKPPNGQMLSDMMKAIKIRVAWCPPTIIAGNTDPRPEDVELVRVASPSEQRDGAHGRRHI